MYGGDCDKLALLVVGIGIPVVVIGILISSFSCCPHNIQEVQKRKCAVEQYIPAHSETSTHVEGDGDIYIDNKFVPSKFWLDGYQFPGDKVVGTRLIIVRIWCKDCEHVIDTSWRELAEQE